MSPLGIASSFFGLVQSGQSINASRSAQASARATDTSGGSDFSSSLTLRMASLQAQSLNTLLGSVFDGNSASSRFDFLTGSGSNSTDIFSLPGSGTASWNPAASGRNLSLFDPESAYRMMSLINNSEVTYKAQFSELSHMKTAVADLQMAGQTLANTRSTMDNEAIRAQLQAFALEYNEWVERFDGTVKKGGVLSGTQAAELSLYELEQSVENVFNGARSGFHGMRDLGLVIDQSTNLASIDLSRLDTALANNREGVVNTITEFSASFVKSAELLNAENNFIPNRLTNLDRVIDYLSDHRPALQAEFGLGNPAQPSAQISKALAAYNQVFKI